MRYKTVILFIIMCVLSICIFFISCQRREKNQKEVGFQNITDDISNKETDISGEFSLADYQKQLEIYKVNIKITNIQNADFAISSAKKIWLEMFSEINNKPYDPIQNRNINVFFDNTNDCWLVKVEIPKDTIGAAPNAIMKSDGTVLAVWMG